MKIGFNYYTIFYKTWSLHQYFVAIIWIEFLGNSKSKMGMVSKFALIIFFNTEFSSNRGSNISLRYIKPRLRIKHTILIPGVLLILYDTAFEHCRIRMYQQLFRFRDNYNYNYNIIIYLHKYVSFYEPIE